MGGGADGRQTRAGAGADRRRTGAEDGADEHRTGAPRQAAELLDGDEKQGGDGRSRTRAATGGCKTGCWRPVTRGSIAGWPAAAGGGSGSRVG